MVAATNGSSATTSSRRWRTDMHFVMNFAAFQVGWFSSVIGGASQLPWISDIDRLFPELENSGSSSSQPIAMKSERTNKGNTITFWRILKNDS